MTIYSSNLIKKVIGIISLSLLFVQLSFAQSVDLHNLKGYIKKESLFDYTGALTATSIYTGGNKGGNQPPLTWMLGLNTNISLFKLINVPFSFSYTNLGGSYKLPQTPNKLAFSPSYKWVATNIGVVNVSWSPYSLNGHQFVGASVDLTPPNLPLSISALYGRFAKAINYDSTNEAFAGASYNRMGGGVKLLYTKTKYNVGVSVFTAKDAPNSITLFPPAEVEVAKPGQNLVMTYLFGVTPLPGLTLSGELANNFLTTDLRDTSEGDKSQHKIVGSVFKIRNSTVTTKAGKAALTYNLTKPQATIGIQYERIDPNYLTYGSYFMANDMENYTATITQVLFNNKVNLMLNGGRQRDDLNNDKGSKNSRNVGSMTLGIVPNTRLNINVSYSNFTSFMFIKPVEQLYSPNPIYQPSDTSNFKQVNANANLSLNYQLTDNELLSRSLMTTVSYQNANNSVGDVVQAEGVSKIYTTIASYNQVWKKSGLNGALTYTHNLSSMFTGNTITQGVTLSVNKTLKQAIRLGYGLSYIQLQIPSKPNSTILSNKIGVAYSKKKFGAQLNIVHQQKSGALKGQDLLGNVNLSYQIK
jgi:hypothetical protein